MPVLDGFETSMRIRELEINRGKRARTPIVALTASATAEYQRKCADCGMDAFISKPLRKDTLWRMLHHFLPEVKLVAMDQPQTHDAECVVKMFDIQDRS